MEEGANHYCFFFLPNYSSISLSPPSSSLVLGRSLPSPFCPQCILPLSFMVVISAIARNVLSYSISEPGHVLHSSLTSSITVVCVKKNPFQVGKWRMWLTLNSRHGLGCCPRPSLWTSSAVLIRLLVSLNRRKSACMEGWLTWLPEVAI